MKTSDMPMESWQKDFSRQCLAESIEWMAGKIDEVHALTVQAALLASYTNDIWLGEFPLEGDDCSNTSELLDFVISGDKEAFDKGVEGKVTKKDEVWLNIKNLHTTVTHYFGDPNTSLEFKQELAQDIHKMVAKDLLQNAGAFRTRLPLRLAQQWCMRRLPRSVNGSVSCLRLSQRSASNSWQCNQQVLSVWKKL